MPKEFHIDSGVAPELSRFLEKALPEIPGCEGIWIYGIGKLPPGELGHPNIGFYCGMNQTTTINAYRRGIDRVCEMVFTKTGLEKLLKDFESKG